MATEDLLLLPFLIDVIIYLRNGRKRK